MRGRRPQDSATSHPNRGRVCLVSGRRPLVSGRWSLYRQSLYSSWYATGHIRSVMRDHGLGAAVVLSKGLPPASGCAGGGGSHLARRYQLDRPQRNNRQNGRPDTATRTMEGTQRRGLSAGCRHSVDFVSRQGDTCPGTWVGGCRWRAAVENLRALGRESGTARVPAGTSAVPPRDGTGVQGCKRVLRRRWSCAR